MPDATAPWRWRRAAPFLVVGGTAIVAGGLVAAVTGPLDLALGSWLAAFLVLVVGVAQVVLGGGQVGLAVDPPSSRAVWLGVALWNAGLAATIAGTMLEAPLVTTLAAVSTVAALVLFLVAVRESQGPRWIRIGYRVFACGVLCSVPIGVVLAWSRHG